LGLLLLRGLVSATLIAQTMTHIVTAEVRLVNVCCAVCAFLVAGCLLVGFMTPIIAIVIWVGAIGFSLLGLQLPNQYLFDTSHTLVDVIALATVILLLGPGAFSLDARMFGRREIRIPSVVSNPIPK
jgi:hypothetical protein